MFVTPSPTPIPVLSTSVSYTFYVEHSADKLKGAVTYDMSFGVRNVLEKFLGGQEDILHGYAVNHDLAIERIAANMVSPTEIGCELHLVCHISVVLQPTLNSHSRPCCCFRPLLPNSARHMFAHFSRSYCFAPVNCYPRPSNLCIATPIYIPSNFNRR